MQYSWFDSKPDGTILGQKVTALQRVGVYVPGGKAAYPSSVLMNIMPAKVAGVDEIIMVTPPGKDGKVTPTTLVAAKEAGADKVYKVGGAQAIAALAYGTESIPKVDKIVGPGNIYVALAKKAATERTVSQHTTILTSERNALSYALVDDIVAHLSQTVNVSLTSTVVTTLYSIVEQTVNRVTIILIILSCIDTTLCCDRVSTTWRVLDAEVQDIEAHLAERCSSRSTCQTCTYNDNVEL